MPDRSEQIESILSAAVEMPDGHVRAKYIQTACGGDDDLQREVEELVAAYLCAGDFLELPTPDLPPTIDLGLAESAGTQLGRYKLLQQIGEGGFAVVFMADQEQPVRRKVAVKVIKPGMDSRQVIARFEAERQALAMMDHSNIAKVLDAGTTESGRPYFVMELVKGKPITEYCDEHSLSIDERLALFSQVCDAVQHAHQKGVIHRDIKPSNVLVRTEDDKPFVKVIDFGIAKATEARLTDMTLFTEFRQLIGTPAYMSPEQAEGSLDIDTRSDVYSLGVLLYELLSGVPPFDPRELKSKAIAEMQRIIREVEPPTPSARLNTLDADTRVLKAKARGFEPDRLAQRLRGELDWIALRALEKDRNRRYRSAAALADDLQNYLNDQPVAACPPSAAYRITKLIRRNKVVILTGSAVAFALMVGFILAMVGLLQARRQAFNLRAETLNKNHGWALMLNAEAKGNSQTAEDLAREALTISRELYGDDDPKTFGSLHVLGYVLVKRNPEEAMRLLRECISRCKSYRGDDLVPTDIAFSLDALANLLRRRGEFAEAETLFREALPIWRLRVGNEHIYVANTLSNLSAVLKLQGKHEEAAKLQRESDAIRAKLAAKKEYSHPVLTGVVDLLKNQGRPEMAEAVRRDAKSSQPTAAPNSAADPPGSIPATK